MEAFHFLSCSPSVCVSVSNSILRGVFLEDCRVPRTAMAADQPWATRWQFVAQVVLFCIFTGDLPAVTLFCIFRKFTGDFPVVTPPRTRTAGRHAQVVLELRVVLLEYILVVSTTVHP